MYINVSRKYSFVVTFVIPFPTCFFRKGNLITQLKHLFYHFILMIGPDGLPAGDAGVSGTSDYSYEEDGSSPPAVKSRHPTGFPLIDNPSIVAPQPDHRFTLIDHNLCMVGDVRWSSEVLEMLLSDCADRDRLPGLVILDIGMLGVVSMCCALSASRKPAVIWCGSEAPTVNQDCLELIHSWLHS
jgi:hypothetical protein